MNTQPASVPGLTRSVTIGISMVAALGAAVLASIASSIIRLLRLKARDKTEHLREMIADVDISGRVGQRGE